MKFVIILAVTTFILGTWGLQAKVPNKELINFTEKLLGSDVNNANEYIRVNLQGRTKSGSSADVALIPLIEISEEAFVLPTINKIRRLYDNYIADTSKNEYVTAQERTEENNFLDEVMNTPVMKVTMEFLSDKGYVGRDYRSQKDLLKELWFTMYSRGGGKVGSSAFEHVFLGELKRGDISGLHNWIFFATEEAKKRANYYGYIRLLDFGGRGSILKLHYKWGNVVKPVGSMFIGTSPELEMALYTVCFLLHPDEKCHVRMNEKHFSVRTHTFRYKGKKLIGSAFPEI